MNQRAEIIARINKASSLQEQAALVAELDAFDRQSREASAAARSLDLTDTIIRETLQPVAVHERHSIETDWLGEMTTTAAADEALKDITVEASLWYRRLSPEVKADRDEFVEQARGMARRTASKYGEQAEGMAQQFLEYTAFLHQREAASGLPQIDQKVDSFENPQPTELPLDVFDTFGPEVHPDNAGVSGTESSERAPFLQYVVQHQLPQSGTPARHDTAPAPYSYAEVPPAGPEQMQMGQVVDGPTQAPTRHNTTQVPYTYSDIPQTAARKVACACGPEGCTCGANAPEGGRPSTHNESPVPFTYAEVPPGDPLDEAYTHSQRSASLGAPLFVPSVAINHTMNLDDFRREAALKKEAAEKCPSCGSSNTWENKGGMSACGDCGRDWRTGEAEDERDDERLSNEDWRQYLDEHHSSLRTAAQVVEYNEYGGVNHVIPADDFPGVQRKASEAGWKFTQGPDGIVGQGPGGEYRVYRVQAAKEAASGLPQVQQRVDSFENPAPMGLPTDVAFPWTMGSDEDDEVSESPAEAGNAAMEAGETANVKPAAGGVGAQNLSQPPQQGMMPPWWKGAAQVTASEKNIRTADGHMVGEGDRVFDYYDGHWGTIANPRDRNNGEGIWFDHMRENGEGRGLLNGDRVAKDKPSWWGKNASLQTQADQWTQMGQQFHGPTPANSPFTQQVPADGGADHANTLPSGIEEGTSDWPGQASDFADASSHVQPFVRGHSIGYGDAAQANPVPGAAQPGELPWGAGGRDTDYQTHEGGLKVSASFTSPVDAADPDFAKAYKFAAKWNPKKPLVRTGSVEFEAGLYAGMSDNPAYQEAWTKAHFAQRDKAFARRMDLHRSFSKKAETTLPGLEVVGAYLRTVANQYIEKRGDSWVILQKGTGKVLSHHDSEEKANAAFRAMEMHKHEGARKTAATSTDLDTTGPNTSPSPTGQTPINGPGQPGPLAGGVDPAAAGGPSPYNGAPPFGSPVVPNARSQHGEPTAIDTSLGGPMDQAALEHLSPQAYAFRKRVQANLLSIKQ